MVKAKNKNILNFPKRISIKQSIISTFNKIYFSITDSKIKKISNITSKYALGYIERLDLSEPKNIRILATSIKHPRKEVVIKGIEKLSSSKTNEAKKIIKSCFSSPNEDVVLTAINAIKLYNGPDVIQMLSSCLVRKNHKVALYALWILAEIKSQESIEAIEEALTINNDEIYRTAAMILKGMKSKRRKAGA